MNIAEVKINYNSFYYQNNLGQLDDLVIVDTDRGLQLGKIINIIYEDLKKDYKEIIRVATKKDIELYNKNKNLEIIAMDKCKYLVEKYKLNMSVLDASYNLDKTQLLFRFISDERVDFRNLAKDLGAKLRTRIELRQIGVRDKAKEIGGIGPCGRMLCCNTFLKTFDTVSINMAKNQGLALNPAKINGVCGRLLCCLNYENEIYEEIKKELPNVGKKIKYKNKEGTVISVDIMKKSYKLLIDNEIIEVGENDSKR